ncbi:5-oxoprolinase subunit C family protein [Saccharibacillus alkalitolerans]|uniref:Biotin-dependent carboxyltransferase family protein n=1 Tax=Saccharibacillus alkalitolerans TaxID=2705290 RepID=A0ABX0FB79_9BACL|nr:biotin-dependent carboxyltransferase family protein [Saccharibacillus alkalitolerans]NGZ77220.1 biotin-dependent carboxyltransferase family protein [Saccharibacillus alkalitolerans]
MTITVLMPGMQTTVQDLGRAGYQKYGVVAGGAADPYALRVANLLVGSDEGAAGLEITLSGPTLRFGRDTLVAVTGGDLSPSVNGAPLPMWRPALLPAGAELRFGAAKSGCRAYLAIAGGFDVPPVMGSRGTYLRAGIGGFEGRELRAGDVLAPGEPGEASLRLARRLSGAEGETFAATSWYADNRYIPPGRTALAVRAVRGPEFDAFSAGSRQAWFSRAFEATPQCDRMGCRLTGPPLAPERPLEMLSEAVAPGTVQVPPDGNPILLLADRQTAGGYPRIAQIAAVDLPVAAQLRPGQRISFYEITAEEAEKLYRDREEKIRLMRRFIELQPI